MANIVLAHGLMGLSRVLGLGFAGQYFNGVEAEFTRQGHAVLAPNVEPQGSLEKRSAQLTEAIMAWEGRDQLLVIGHSMGGLDIRRAVAKSPSLARRIKTIVTIATPHYGSPLADALLDNDHPLRSAIPSWLSSTFGANSPAMQDLRTRASLHDPNVPGIVYCQVPCETSKDDSRSPLVALTQAIGRLGGGDNDGLVTVRSAVGPANTILPTWYVDHNAAIGWPSGRMLTELLGAVLAPPADHLKRYNDLLAFTGTRSYA